MVKENKIQIIIAYVYHAIFILLAFLLMRNDSDILLYVFIIAGILYLIYWVVSRKGHMAWIVYLNFVIGTVIELLLNGFRIIPEDGGFLSGLAQLFYMVLLVIHVAVLGIANLILWLIDKWRQRADNSDHSI